MSCWAAVLMSAPLTMWVKLHIEGDIVNIRLQLLSDHCPDNNVFFCCRKETRRCTMSVRRKITIWFHCCWNGMPKLTSGIMYVHNMMLTFLYIVAECLVIGSSVLFRKPVLVARLPEKNWLFGSQATLHLLSSAIPYFSIIWQVSMFCMIILLHSMLPIREASYLLNFMYRKFWTISCYFFPTLWTLQHC